MHGCDCDIPYGEFVLTRRCSEISMTYQQLPMIRNGVCLRICLVKTFHATPQHLPYQPFSFTCPVCILVTGPLHVIWNALETHVKTSVRRVVLHPALPCSVRFVSDVGLKARCMLLCMSDAIPSARSLVYRFRLTCIAWKWQRLSQGFVDVSNCVEVR